MPPQRRWMANVWIPRGASGRRSETKVKAKRSEGVRGLITISYTPPGTAPQWFGSLLSQRIARKAVECQCQDAKASAIYVEYAKKRVISPGGGLCMSAKSTATKTTISQYSNIPLYYREGSPHFTPSQGRCLEKYQHLSRCFSATHKRSSRGHPGSLGEGRGGSVSVELGLFFRLADARTRLS